MARTPYADPEAEKAYQSMSDNSSQPSADDNVDPNDMYNKNLDLKMHSNRSTFGKIQRDNKARY